MHLQPHPRLQTTPPVLHSLLQRLHPVLLCQILHPARQEQQQQPAADLLLLLLLGLPRQQPGAFEPLQYSSGLPPLPLLDVDRQHYQQQQQQRLAAKRHCADAASGRTAVTASA